MSDKTNKYDISKIVKQSDLFKVSITNEQHFIPFVTLLNLAEQLHGCKSDFISKTDATTLLYSILSNHLNDKVKLGFTIDPVVGQEQTLSQIFSSHEIEKIQLEIIEYFESLPRKYRVHFHLPKVFYFEPLEIKINKQICLKFDNPRKESSLFGQVLLANAVENKSYSLSVYIDYVGHLAYGSYEKLFSIFKQFIYLGICQNLFSFNKNYIGILNFQPQGGLFSALSTSLDPLSNYFTDINSDKKNYINLEKNENDFIHRIEMNPELSSTEIKITIDRFCKSFNLLLHASNKSDKAKILAGLEWAFNSEINENETFKFILKCIAIEAVVGDADSEKSTLKLTNRCAYQLASSHQERKYYLDKFPKLYKLRSHLVHGNKVSLAPDEKELFYFADTLLRRIFLSELKLLHNETIDKKI